jgi:hypothetical protein
MHIGFMEFWVFVFYYIILKGAWQFLNVEARRNGWTIPAALSGLFA